MSTFFRLVALWYIVGAFLAHGDHTRAFLLLIVAILLVIFAEVRDARLEARKARTEQQTTWRGVR